MAEVHTIRSTLDEAVARLAGGGSTSARRDAEVLLLFVLDAARTLIYTHPDRELESDEWRRFAALVQRRESGEPIAYLTGTREFWSLPVVVTPAVLIPRPDTECLVEACLDRMPRGAGLRVQDVGVGSGAIVAALASERPTYSFFGVDRSGEALEICRQNLRRLGQLDRVVLRRGDLLLGGPVGLDWIVSNPPYIRRDDFTRLMPDVRDFEPQLALESGSDGLDAIRRLVGQAPTHLTSGGHLALEHGMDQQDAVVALMKDAGFRGIVRGLDLGSRPRFVIGSLA